MQDPGPVFRESQGEQLSSCWCGCLCPSVLPPLSGPTGRRQGQDSGGIQRKGDFAKSSQPPGPSLPPPAPPPSEDVRAWHTMWLGGSRGRRIPLPLPTCALVLQSADSAPQTSAGWKVRKLPSLPAHSLGLSVPICLGGVLSGDIRGGFGRGSGVARRGLSGGLQHLPQASHRIYQLQDYF